MKPFSQRNIQVLVIVLICAGIIALALAGYLRPVIGVVSSPVVSVQRWISLRYVAIYDFLTSPRDVASLRTENSQLTDEVAQLQTQIITLQQQLSDTQVLYALLNFARAQPQNQYVAASVIGRDPSPFVHYVIIDHGSDDGLKHGMPVVTEQGLVGRIDAVTAEAARVELITDTDSVVNVHLQSVDRDAELIGSLTGDISLDMVSQDINLQPGEIVLTSSLGGLYPSNILIGQVTSVRKQENALFQTAVVQPAVNFTTLSAVLVITNFQPVDTTTLVPTPEQ
ncbi:MAG: rod shape-determining protein MreC [Anaerolineaceae bacterium]|jgi:rod shape-determining protein MreC